MRAPASPTGGGRPTPRASRKGPKAAAHSFIAATTASAVQPGSTRPASSKGESTALWGGKLDFSANYSPSRGTETRFIAGFAHEDQPLEEQLFVLDLIERSVGERVTISSVSGPPDMMPKPPLIIPPALTAIQQSTDKKRLPGHMCTGPVAVSGARAGQVIEFEAPGGARQLKVVKVLYQPEAAGDFHL